MSIIKNSPADHAEKWPIDRLIPYVNNARTHSDEQVAQIAASMTEWGWTNPVLVDEDGMIIAGHGRILAARKLGIDTVPVIVATGWTEAQKKAYVIADNQLGLNAGWDIELLKTELHGLDELGFDLELIGMPDLDSLMAAMNEGLTDPDEVPELTEQPVTFKGGIWCLGNHRLMCGDSTNAQDVGNLLNGVKCHMIFTSPPYNVGKDYGGHDDGMAADEYQSFIAAVLHECASAMHKGGMIAWNIGVAPRSRPYMHALWLESAGFEFYRQIVWKKTGAQIPLWQNSVKKPDARRYMPNYMHELIYIASLGSVSFGGKTSMPDDISSDVWDISQFSAGGTGHPAAFPAQLACSVVKALSAPGEIVFEPFSGSGTMLIASEIEARRCLAMELNPAYVDMAVERWQNFTGEDAVYQGEHGKGRTFNEVREVRGKQDAPADA